MATDACEFFPSSGKNQYFKAVREWDALCGDSNAIEILRSIGFPPRFVEKLSLNFAQVSRRAAHPAHHEAQIANRVGRAWFDGYPITGGRANASMRFDLQGQVAVELGHSFALVP